MYASLTIGLMSVEFELKSLTSLMKQMPRGSRSSGRARRGKNTKRDTAFRALVRARKKHPIPVNFAQTCILPEEDMPKADDLKADMINPKIAA